MRYQSAYGTAWLVTTTTKSAASQYGKNLDSQELIEKGLNRLKALYKKKAYTSEQKENRGIARKGIKHLEKQNDLRLKCKMYSVNELLDSMRNGRPLKGVIITTGFEFVQILKDAGLDEEADDVLRVMKSPTTSLHSDSVTSVRLIG